MADTIVHRFFETARKRGDAPAYLTKQGGIWHATSWREYGEQGERAARALIQLGLEAGDRVCILGFNRPEWAIFDVGAMAAGGVPAGIYTSCSPEEVKYIVDHSEAPFVLVENEAQWKKVDEVRDQLPKLKKVILMKGAQVDDDLCIGWDDFLALGDDDGGDIAKEREERTEALELDQLATLIYTSGTTGPPKGVMLSHENLAWTSRIAVQVAALDSSSRSLSYLPLSHIAEQIFTIHGPITAGSTVYFAESIDKIADNLKDCRPTMFFGVPRIWEKFYSAINAKLAQATGIRAKLVDWARSVGTRANELKTRGEEPSGLLGMQYALAQRLVFSKLHAAVGLDQATTLVSGAAPISREIIEFFAGLDLVVQEVYGQSEDTGPTSFNLVGRTKFGSVGPPFPGVDVKIAEDGEIVVKGPNVFLGYFKDEGATKETLDEDGWLHSGDLGKFDDDGFLYITGRKKDIIITAGGKNITPKNIESGIKNHPLVHEAVVIGDRRKYLSAVISPDVEACEKFIADEGLKGEPHEIPEIHDSIMEMVREVNSNLARVEQVKKIKILPRPLTIEDGELTPTLKVKRAKVNEHFAELIDSIYEE